MRIKLILPNARGKDETLSDFTYSLKLLTPKTMSGGKNIMAFMPLALPTLAALTPRDVDVSIVDENVEAIDFDDPVDLVGISFVSYMARRAYQIADRFRELGVHVVLGGVHVSLFPDEALLHADTVVVGEAETLWPRFLDDLARGRAARLYRCEVKPDLQTRVVPRWDLVKNRYYLTQLVQTTRGCPFDCDFCMIRSIYGSPRSKPVDDVLAEIEEVARLKRVPGPLKIMFADDNIVANAAYAKDLFARLIPLGIRWSSQASITIAGDDELLELARRSGCDSLLIGFESLSQQNLDSVRKGQNQVTHFGRAIDRIHAAGINIYGFFIFGFDHDGPSVFRDTTDFIQQTGIEFPLFNLLAPLPGTRIHRRLEQEGRLFPLGWDDLNGYSVCFRPQQMSAEELLEGFHWSITRCYSGDAILERLARAHESGALAGDGGHLLRLGLSALLLLNALRQDASTRRFILHMLREMWLRRDAKVNAMLMFLDRFDFARRLEQRRARR